jgi:outer membrane protein TolC
MRSNIKRGNSLLHSLPVLAAAVFLGGCATFSTDGGLDVAGAIARDKLGLNVASAQSDDAMAAQRAEVTALLGRPLTPETAAQIALYNNPGLQAAYAELRAVEADRVQAGRLPNPGYSYKKLGSDAGSSFENKLGINLGAILTLPLAENVEQQRFESAKLKAAAQTVAVALGARRAWIDAVAARQAADYMQQVVESAEAGRELANRMRSVGNWSRLDEHREQLFYAEAAAQRARAEQAALAAREELVRTLGLWGGDLGFTLPARLPDLPAALRELADAERVAVEQRLDIRAARRNLDAEAELLGLTRVTRWVNVLHIEGIREREADGSVKRGFEIGVNIPLFDWGDARVAKAEALYLQAALQLRETAINARSEVREAWHAYRIAYDLARHYRDEIVPLRKRISDEQLLRYNGMLIGVFELIADSRDQVASINAYLQALRDSWLAEADLQQALLGRADAGRRGGSVAMPAGGAAGH